MMRALSLMLAIVLSAPAVADDAGKLVELLKPYRQFSAEFRQATLDREGNPVSQVDGRLAIRAADVFFWQTEQPFAQQIVADGEVVWIYDQDLLQVQVRPITDALGATPAAVLGGDSHRLMETFQIEANRLGEVMQYRLIPVAADDVTQAIELRFDGSHLMDMQVVDALGNRTQIRLTSLDRSIPPAEQFEFVPPAGADVIYALGAQ